MNDNKNKKNLLKVVLILGALALSGFGLYYYFLGQTFMALVEGSSVLVLIFGLIWLSTGNYLGPAILGWVGVYSVFMTLLFTGGVGGTGIIWWGLMPVLGFVMFGITGGTISLFVLLISFLLVWVAILTDLVQFFYGAVFVRQMLILMLVEGTIVYFFEQSSEKSKLYSEEQTKKIEVQIAMRLEAEKKFAEISEEIKSQELRQTKLTSALINILEDLKEGK